MYNFEDLKKLISSYTTKLTADMSAAIAKYSMYGVTLPVGNLNSSWYPHELLFNNTVSIELLNSALLNAKANLAKEVSQDLSIDETANESSFYKKLQTPYVTVKFTWQDAVDALGYVILARQCLAKEAANEKEKSNRLKEIARKKAILKDRIAEKDPVQALKELEEIEAKLL